MITRRRGFILLSAALLLGALELISHVGLKIFDRRHGLKVLGFPPGRDHHDKLLKGKLYRYDRAHGWDGPETVRWGRRYPPGRRYFASSYGDSFTWCADVHTPGDTWQGKFESRTGRAILNLGIAAAGTDQAYLKLLKRYRTYPTDVVILGIQLENISRLLSVVRLFYYSSEVAPLVKPRYVLGADGKITLLENPIASAADLHRLSDRSFIARIARHDYWYQHRLRRFGFDMIRGRSFPALPDVLRLLTSPIDFGAEEPGYHAFYSRPGSEPFRLMVFIVDQFLARGREFGFRPVIIIHVFGHDMEDPSFARPLVELIRHRGIPVLEVPVLFRQAVDRGTPLEQLYRKAHYSPRGNEIVARGLERMLREERILE